MKTLKTLMLASLFAVPAFAQNPGGNGAAAGSGDQLQTQTQTQAGTQAQLRDGTCDGTQKRQQLRDGSGAQARSQDTRDRALINRARRVIRGGETVSLGLHNASNAVVARDAPKPAWPQFGCKNRCGVCSD
jgi:hypothetical protein